MLNRKWIAGACAAALALSTMTFPAFAEGMQNQIGQRQVMSQGMNQMPGMNQGNQQGQMPGMNQGSQQGQMPEMNQGSQQGQMPGMNQGNQQGQMPEMNQGNQQGQMPEMNQGNQQGQMPEMNQGNQQGQMPEMNQGDQQGQMPEMNQGKRQVQMPQMNQDAENGEQLPELPEGTEKGGFMQDGQGMRMPDDRGMGQRGGMADHQPMDLDKLVEDGTIDEDVASKISAFMQANKPDDQNQRVKPEERTEGQEAGKGLWEDLLEEGILSQEQYDAITAQQPEQGQKGEKTMQLVMGDRQNQNTNTQSQAQDLLDELLEGNAITEDDYNMLKSLMNTGRPMDKGFQNGRMTPPEKPAETTETNAEETSEEA